MTIQKINNLPSGFFNNSNEKEKIFSSDVLDSFPNSTKPENAFKKIVNSNKNSDLLNQVLVFELKTEIPGAQTWRIDRAGSAHALELREPFLDHNLVEFCASIPASLKISKNGETRKKYILQKLAEKYLPQEIAQRKKFPWGIPYFDYFTKEFLPIAECILDKSVTLKRPFLNSNRTYVKDLFSNVLKTEDRSITSKDIEINDRLLRQIMFLFNLEIWYNTFIENDNLRNPSLSINHFL